jgi:peptide/nickel transport system permease protein
MGAFLVRRLLSAIPVLFVVSLVTFLLIWLVPGDVASEIAGPGATAQEIAAIREQYGLDRPIYVRAAIWYRNLLEGDLGRSYLLRRSVVDAIFERAPVTLSLTALALVLTIALGVFSGVVAAVRHGTWADQSAMSLALLGLSLPDFWFGLVLIYAFAVALGWFPTGGFVPLSEDFWGWVRHMTLPALTLAVTQLGVVARMTRSSMLDVLRQDYIRTAEAKGLPRRLVVYKHALSNALIPVVTVIGVIVGILLGGAVVIETVYSLPGMGRLIIGAIQRRDYPVIQGGLLLTACIFVFINIVVDVLYGLLDPRIRHER